VKNILVTGGLGYIGSLLCPQLIGSGYNVIAFDIGWFGTDHLPKEVVVERADIRNHKYFKYVCKKYEIDAVINLACVSNDASFELDEKLSKSINLDAFEPMIMSAKSAGVKRFISVSTSSVYGVSDALEITEEHPLVPLTLYNEYKGLCEPLLFKHQSDDFVCVVIRSATICGVSPRQRLDLSVNILTHHAIINNVIKVFGGEQMRPNLHIQDICNLYELLLRVDSNLIAGKIFNCAYSNSTINNLARVVKNVVAFEFPEQGEIDIVTVPTDDIRSYHINSNKIKTELGFYPGYSIAHAIDDLCRGFKFGYFPNSMDDTIYYNVKHLKKIGIG